MISQNPDAGVANFRILLYTTCANGTDGDDEMPTFIIYDECHNAFNYGSHGEYKEWCAYLCWPCWCGEPCLGVATHFKNEWTMPLYYSGKFTVKALWRDRVEYANDFEFKKTSQNRLPNFLDTHIMSSANEIVPENAIFDIDEGINISVTAEWDVEPENPDLVIEAVIKASNGDDSLITDLPLVNALPISEYKGNLAAGTLRQLFDDAFWHFEHWNTEELIVYPRKAGCQDDSHHGPEDRARIGAYLFWVDTITFADCQKLCREDPRTAQGTSPVTEPHWNIAGKNEPVCYVRNQDIGMNIKIRTNHTPMHRLPVEFWALADNSNWNFFVPRDTFEISNNYRIDINNIRSNGPIPDSIGYDSLSYYWQFRVSPLREPRTGTVSGPHIIYRIYDKPIKSHSEVYPINVNACLEKVCKEYAPDLNDIENILEQTSAGIYSDYFYNPSFSPGIRPYDLFRSPIKTGLCADYANYMAAVIHSIGIRVNCRTLFSGSEGSTNTILDSWNNLYYYHNYPPADSIMSLLWTVANAGNNHSPDGAYDFSYHMVTRYLKVDSTGIEEIIYDPCYNKNGEWRDWLEQEIRYYYNADCNSSEPPPADPAIYDWPSNALSKLPTPNWRNSFEVKHYDCRHPDY